MPIRFQALTALAPPNSGQTFSEKFGLLTISLLSLEAFLYLTLRDVALNRMSFSGKKCYGTGYNKKEYGQGRTGQKGQGKIRKFSNRTSCRKEIC